MILVLDKGVIVERGTHRELIAQDGYYGALVKRQSLAIITGKSNLFATTQNEIKIEQLFKYFTAGKLDFMERITTKNGKIPKCYMYKGI